MISSKESHTPLEDGVWAVIKNDEFGPFKSLVYVTDETEIRFRLCYHPDPGEYSQRICKTPTYIILDCLMSDVPYLFDLMDTALDLWGNYLRSEMDYRVGWKRWIETRAGGTLLRQIEAAGITLDEFVGLK